MLFRSAFTIKQPLVIESGITGGGVVTNNFGGVFTANSVEANALLARTVDGGAGWWLDVYAGQLRGNWTDESNSRIASRSYVDAGDEATSNALVTAISGKSYTFQNTNAELGLYTNGAVVRLGTNIQVAPWFSSAGTGYVAGAAFSLGTDRKSTRLNSSHRT